MHSAQGAPGAMVSAPPEASSLTRSCRLPIAGRAAGSYGTSILISRKSAPSPSKTWIWRVPRRAGVLQRPGFFIGGFLLAAEHHRHPPPRIELHHHVRALVRDPDVVAAVDAHRVAE